MCDLPEEWRLYCYQGKLPSADQDPVSTLCAGTIGAGHCTFVNLAECLSSEVVSALSAQVDSLTPGVCGPEISGGLKRLKKSKAITAQN